MLRDETHTLHLAENLTPGATAVGYRAGSMQGAEAPQALRIMISRQGNLEQKQNNGQKLCRNRGNEPCLI